MECPSIAIVIHVRLLCWLVYCRSAVLPSVYLYTSRRKASRVYFRVFEGASTARVRVRMWRNLNDQEHKLRVRLRSGVTMRCAQLSRVHNQPAPVISMGSGDP